MAALLHAFLYTYPTDIPTFADWRTMLRGLLAESTPRLARWKERCDDFGYLSPDGTERFAEQWAEQIDNNKDIEQFLARAGLEGVLAGGRFLQGASFHLTRILYLRLAQDALDVQGLERFLRVFRGPSSRLRFESTGPSLATALLRPYRQRRPEVALENTIRKFLVSLLGDPRLREDQWYSVDAEDRQVLKNWLVQVDLEAFFDILNRTAVDRHWSYRRKFWTDFLQRGMISEAWVVLGPSARRLVKQDDRAVEFLYGRLKRSSGVDRNHSVLLMKIGGAGGVTVAEWSHNGSLRFWLDGNQTAPALYAEEYSRPQLRDGCDHRIAHMASERSHWQQKALRWLMQQVGYRT